MHVSNLYGSPQGEALAQRIVDNELCRHGVLHQFGRRGDRVRDQDRAPLSLCQRQSARYKLITFNNAFHGRTLGAISATNQPKMRDGFEPLLPGFAYASSTISKAALALIDDDTAGFLVETVQGEGGMTAGDAGIHPGPAQGVRRAWPAADPRRNPVRLWPDRQVLRL
jgi:acetylornithine/N-succinyldiaminopimelate aminotransferase